jgi:hypothetical protein
MKNFKQPPKMVFAVHGEKNNLDTYTKAIKERMDVECTSTYLFGIGNAL